DDEFERFFVHFFSLLLLLEDAHILVVRAVRIPGFGFARLLCDGRFARGSRFRQIGRSFLTDRLVVDAASTA
ncbi:hypothetical protein PENTCL1PPCAC_5700, partial [Pristionchus entomophagus]